MELDDTHERHTSQLLKNERRCTDSFLLCHVSPAPKGFKRFHEKPDVILKSIEKYEKHYKQCFFLWCFGGFCIHGVSVMLWVGHFSGVFPHRLLYSM